MFTVQDLSSEPKLPPEEIVRIFRTGCSNTLHDSKPEGCEECFGYALGLLLLHSFTPEEAISLLKGPQK